MDLDKYFSKWAIEAGEEIEKKAIKEKWDEFDYISAINFMLMDIGEDMKKEIEKIKKERLINFIKQND